jgi:hypothetical protein
MSSLGWCCALIAIVVEVVGGNEDDGWFLFVAVFSLVLHRPSKVTREYS